MIQKVKPLSIQEKFIPGNGWRNYVDAIIGITVQATPGDAETIPGITELGGNCMLVKWQVYWMDDNSVLHEVSHLFYEMTIMCLTIPLMASVA